MSRSADDDLVGPDIAKNVARLLVEKIEIEKFVRQPDGQVSQRLDFRRKGFAVALENARLGFRPAVSGLTP